MKYRNLETLLFYDGNYSVGESSFMNALRTNQERVWIINLEEWIKLVVIQSYGYSKKSMSLWQYACIHFSSLTSFHLFLFNVGQSKEGNGISVP